MADPADMPRILVGDVLERLAELPAESVQCVVTSPPYWGLRDYGTGTWDGGDPTCDHKGEPMRTRANVNTNTGVGTDRKNAAGHQPYGQICGKCGARRVDQQIGLEPTPEAYVERMVAVFREVRRVLRADGTVWANLGDGYASSPAGNKTWNHGAIFDGRDMSGHHTARQTSTVSCGLKPKDLIGMPWRLAFALQADGWWLRQDIIWHKPNPMPESVTDRCTKSHEYLFLLSKRATYYYDAEAIAEAGKYNGMPERTTYEGKWSEGAAQTAFKVMNGRRNKRSVWTIPTQPYPEAHFATFPEALVEPCILAGTSDKGCCPACGAPWRRVVNSELRFASGSGRSGNPIRGKNGPDLQGGGETGDIRKGPVRSTQTVGWEPGCTCGTDGACVPCTVLDPFLGSGTTAAVARRLGRAAIGIELNPEYVELARARIGKVQPPLPGLAM